MWRGRLPGVQRQGGVGRLPLQRIPEANVEAVGSQEHPSGPAGKLVRRLHFPGSPLGGGRRPEARRRRPRHSPRRQFPGCALLSLSIPAVTPPPSEFHSHVPGEEAAAPRSRPEGQSRCSDLPPSTSSSGIILPRAPDLRVRGGQPGAPLGVGGPGQPGSIAVKANEPRERQSPTKGPR